MFSSYQTVEVLLSVVWTSQSTTVQFCAFCETKPLCKNTKCDAYVLFCGTNSHNRQVEDHPGGGFFKSIFIHSDYSRPNSFWLWWPGSGSN